MRDRFLIIATVLVCAGCAATSGTQRGGEGLREQLDAAQKVVGAMAPSKAPAEKYSPLTGKHYSGTLEVEPGTGVRLIPVEE